MKLNRRGLFGFIAAFVPLGAAQYSYAQTAPIVKGRAGLRVSNVRGDVAEKLTAELTLDCKIKIFLDGVEQDGCVTADEDRGYVVRFAKSKSGDVLINHSTNEIIHETVHGDVRIEIT